MSNLALVIIVGILGGIAVAFQNPLAGLMGRTVGAIESAFIVHLGGTIVAGLLLLAMGGRNIGAWRSAPWYALLSGVLGVMLIASLSYTIPKMGVAAAVTLIVVAQLSIGAVLDHYGVLVAMPRSLDLSRTVGVSLLFVGTWLILK
jgi:transporter family-2 protein